MPRTSRYYYDWSEVKGTAHYRYRLVLIPADSASNSLTSATPPDWMDTAGKSGWVHIGSDVVKSVNTGSLGYVTSYPVGLPTTPTLEATFELGALAGNDLLTYLTEPRTDGGVSLTIPNTSPAYTYSRPSSLVCRLYTNFGNGSLVQSLAFEGALLLSPNRITLYNEDKDEAERTLVFEHIFKVCAQTLEPDMLARHMLLNYNTTANGAKTGKWTNVYHTLWDDGSASYAACSGTFGAASSRFRCRFFSLMNLTDAFADLLQLVRRDYVRDSSVDVEFLSMDASNPSAAYGECCPYDYIKLFERSYDSSCTKGSEISSSAAGAAYHSKSEVFYIAAYWIGTDNYSVGTSDLYDAYDAGDLRGGYLHPNDPDGVFGYDDLYSWAVDWVGGVCKVAYTFNGNWTTAHDLQIYFHPVGSPRTVARSERDLQPTDIVKDGEGEIAEGVAAGTIRACRVPIAGAQGEDLSEVVYATGSGSAGDQELGLQLHFHNAPLLLDKDDFEWQNPGSSTTENGDFSGTYYSYKVDLYSARRLYYFDTPSFMSGEVPILCHNQVTIHTGLAEVDTGTTVDNPTLLDPTSGGGFSSTSGGNPATHETNIINLRAQALALQKLSCMSYGMAETFGDLFSQARLWKTDLTVLRTNGRYDDLGNRYNLHNSSDVLTGLPILCPSALDAFSVYPKSGYCVGIAWEDGDLATVTLLGIPS